MLYCPYMKQRIPSTYALVALLIAAVIVTACGCNYRLIPSECPCPPPPFYVPERTRVALVLGSGGVRGMAHVGVLQELENAGIPIDLIVGCSAGSIVGALYADSPCVDSIMGDVWSLRTQSIIDIDLWNCRYGLSWHRNMREVLDRALEAETFEDLQIPLVIVASDLNSGELVPIGAGDLLTAIEASCSIPFVFVPCSYGGRVLVDGGVVNPVPSKVARDLGADIVIAVDLCELLPRTFPTNLFQIASRSAEIAFMWQNQLCCRCADVVIRPKTCDIGAFNDSMKWQIYEAGRMAACEEMPRILELVGALPPDGCEPVAWRLVEPTCYTPEIYLQEDCGGGT